MKFFSYPMSPNCRRVAATLAHLGLEAETVLVDLGKGATRTPEYLAVNPHGRVPALIDGDFHLSESYAIMQYLCSKKPGNTLFPADARSQADINRWMFWAASTFSRPTGDLTYENLVKPMFGMGETDPAAVEKAQEGFRSLARLLDAHLADRKFLVGDGVTLADFTVASMLTYSEPARMPVSEFPNLQAWLARMETVPAWTATAPQPMAHR